MELKVWDFVPQTKYYVLSWEQIGELTLADLKLGRIGGSPSLN